MLDKNEDEFRNCDNFPPCFNGNGLTSHVGGPAKRTRTKSNKSETVLEDPIGLNVDQIQSAPRMCLKSEMRLDASRHSTRTCTVVNSEIDAFSVAVHVHELPTGTGSNQPKIKQETTRHPTVSRVLSTNCTSRTRHQPITSSPPLRTFQFPKCAGSVVHDGQLSDHRQRSGHPALPCRNSDVANPAIASRQARQHLLALCAVKRRRAELDTDAQRMDSTTPEREASIGAPPFDTRPNRTANCDRDEDMNLVLPLTSGADIFPVRSSDGFLEASHHSEKSPLSIDGTHQSHEQADLLCSHPCAVSRNLMTDHVSSYESDGPSVPALADHSAVSSDRDVPLHGIAKRGRRLSAPVAIPIADEALQLPRADPDTDFPKVCTDFSGIPNSAIGDLIQVWDFMTSFSGTLRISPFKFLHFEKAVVYGDRCALLDACLVRLVQSTLSDAVLVKELSISESVVKSVSGCDAKSAAGVVLQCLPNILSFQTDDLDGDILQQTVLKLDAGRMAFYKTIDAAGRLRILRELVDYASMTDKLRECVADSLEHAEEERKKAREEFTANRKRIESQIRDLRSELQDYKLSNGLIEVDPPTVPNVGSKSNTASGIYCDVGVSPSIHTSSENKSKISNFGERSHLKEVNTEVDPKNATIREPSRQEALQQVIKERRLREERRVKELGVDAIVARIEKARANLKSLKNSRVRTRSKEGDSCEGVSSSRAMYTFETPEDPVRSMALGADRHNRCYWFFEGCGRLWIENFRSAEWSALTSMESVHGLLNWLSSNRREEVLLKASLTQRLEVLELEMANEAKLIELGKEEGQDRDVDHRERLTRAKKRKLRGEDSSKPKRAKPVFNFLSYRNTER